jgi:hypothetical protein
MFLENQRQKLLDQGIVRSLQDDDVETDEEVLGNNVSDCIKRLNEAIEEFTVDERGKKTTVKCKKT